MKYPSRNTSTLFCEQVNTVTNLFEKWNQCERTVVMYALLKRLKYPSLKFLLNSIESTLLHHSSTTNSSTATTTTTNNSSNSSSNNSNSCNAMTMADINANDPKYLKNLLISYNTTQMVVVADKENINCGGSPEYLMQSMVGGTGGGSTGSGSTLCGFSLTEPALPQNNKSCLRKEEILNDILCLLPLLKPGNDDAKKIYLSLIPTAVEDSVKSYVPTELVQQIFSYLLIHPAISNEDRR